MNLRRLVFLLVVCFFYIFSFSDKPVFCQETPTKTPLSSFPPGYLPVDSIRPGTLAGWLAMDMGYGTTVLRTEVVSPFDGSTAIMQERVSYSYMDAGWSGLSRNYQLGYTCSQGAKIALYAVLHAPPSGGNSAALISITFENQVCNGDSYTIFDEIRILPFSTPGQTLQFSESPTYILIGKDDQSSGMVLRAKTSDPATVTFKVGDLTFAQIPTENIDGSNIAKYTWWGMASTGQYLPDGSYPISASADGKTENLTSVIKHIPTLKIGFRLPPNGLFSKDPTGSVYPGEPQCVECVTSLGDDMANSQKGYVSGVLVDDPVNIVSGNYSLPQIDLRLRSRIPLILSRIYNSLDMSSGPFGRGWSSPFFVNLNIGVSTASLKLSDGSKVLFKKQGNAFLSDSDSGLKLTFSSDTNFWTVTNPKGSEWTFDTSGKIIRMAHACCGKGAADATLIDYDSKGYLSKITNPERQCLNFTINTSGKISSVKDSDGRTITYKYDDKGNLISFTDPHNRVTTYSYDESGFLTSLTKPGSRVTTITYADNRASSIKNPDNTISTFDWASGTNRSVTLTDTKGTKHLYNFDDSWNLASYSLPTGGVEKGFTASGSFITCYRDSNGAETHFEYDNNGLMTSKTDSLGNTWHYEYHPAFRKLTKKTDPLGQSCVYSWCPKGNLLSETDPLGKKISYTYDQWNNRIARTDPLGRTLKYEFDPNGNKLLRIIDPLGGVASFSYDKRGNLISASDQLNRILCFEYDKLDRLTKTTFPDKRYISIEYNPEGKMAARTDNLGRRAEYTYDPQGRLLSTKRPDGSIISSEYDSAGRLISTIDPLGNKTKFDYNDFDCLVSVDYSDSNTRTYEYDGDKRLVSEKTELGAQTKFEYDSEGRLTAKIDPAGNRWESTYDAVGRIVTEKNPLNHSTSFFYDNLNRLIKVERADGTKITNVYDIVGNLVKTTDAAGATWTWQYDALDRQIRAIRPDGASSTICYDAVGQVISVINPLGRETKSVYDFGGRPIKRILPTGAVFQYSYDQAGRLIALTDPLGAVATMGYDVMGRVLI
ncbi:MAG: RHS repeat protein [Candidatus Riflebacteria bacterium]|nr:RHS repeat protein [Candidatus Riflebacteria bacterium]